MSCRRIGNWVMEITESVERRFWSKVKRRPGGCWEWQASRLPMGYGRIQVGAAQVYAHRLSWEMEHGPIPDGLFVCHHCDNPSCVNPAHLFLGTPVDNVRDSIKKGRFGLLKVGWRSPTKYTEAQVREIRKRYMRGGVSQRQLAREYGMSQGNLWSIVNRKTWTQLDDDIQAESVAPSSPPIQCSKKG
jgi:hypothetical protein